MSWICNKCETSNSDFSMECEVCSSVAPQIKSVSHSDIDVSKPTTITWEAIECDVIILIHDEKEYEVTGTRSIELLITKNSTLTFKVSNPTTNKIFTFPLYVAPPRILDFHSDSSCVLEGTTILLEWEVTNCNRVEIEGLGIQPAKGSKPITATRSSFKIVAENSSESVTNELRIELIKKPIINLKLTKSKLRKHSAEKSQLKWKVKNCVSVKLKTNKEEKDVSSSGNETVAPTDTTTYELQVLCLDNKTIFTKKVTLYVLSDSVVDFKSSTFYTYPRIPFVLSWNVQHAKKVELTGMGVVDACSSKTVEISKDTTYELKVEGAFGRKNKQLSIKTIPLPVIKSLMVPTPNINQCTRIELNTPKVVPIIGIPPNLCMDIQIPPLIEPNFEKINVKMNDTPKYHTLNMKLKGINWWNHIWSRLKNIKGFKY